MNSDDRQQTVLTAYESYLAERQEESERVRAAYIGAAVTEIASFRAQLSGPQQG